jgi:two-component system response regulator DevR
MIRVAVLDDHPAVLAGVRRLLEASDDFVPVAAVDTAEELLLTLNRARADVAILDYDLGRSDGLAVCQRLKERMCPPRVVVYSAYAGPALVLAARVAGADAVVDKRAPVRDLLDAIHRVADGERVFPDVPLELRQTLVAGLKPDEIPVAAMLLAGTSPNDVAEALSTDRRDVAHRTRRIVARLRPKPKSYDAASDNRDLQPATALTTGRARGG